MNRHQTIAIEPFHYESASEHVTDLGRILMLMERLGQAAGVLTLAFPDMETFFCAPVLLVDSQRYVLRVGRLQPTAGNEHLRALGVVNVYGELEGVKFHFRTTVEDPHANGHADDHAGDGGFHLCFPLRVDIQQRREYLRLSVDDQRGVPVRLEIDRAESAPRFVQGVLADISLGGLSLHLPLSADLREGEVVDYCTLALPGGENLMCALRIRHVRRDDLQGRIEVGTSFVELNPIQERIVHRYVIALERQVAWGGGLVWQPGAA